MSFVVFMCSNNEFDRSEVSSNTGTTSLNSLHLSAESNFMAGRTDLLLH